ncbi:sugar phosphate isomerase/epimerase family protein [Microbulbifer sp. PAAF003]|uniref:sugar phosphate isomerase/epimerase family protein n=1 Tax=Microbulbifer sp. PAAF003 TaxID=3243375 RepID=UPI0040395EA8
MTTKKIEAQLGVQLWSVRHELNRDFSGTLKRLKAAGFNAIELATELGPYKEKPNELRSLLEQLKLKVSGAHVSITQLLPESIDATATYYQTLGAEYLIVGWDPRSWDPNGVDKLISQLRSAQSVLSKYGLKMGFHNHDKEFSTYQNTTFWDYISQSTDDNFILQLDIGWVSAAGKDPINYLKRYPGRTYTTHFKSWVPDENINNKAREPLNNSVIPLACKAVHNQGAASQECLDLSRSCNAECESLCEPRRAGLEGYSCCVAALAKGYGHSRRAAPNICSLQGPQRHYGVIQRLPIIGMDLIDWPSIIEASIEVGGSQWIILEQETAPKGMETIEALIKSKANLQQYLSSYMSTRKDIKS